MRYRPQYRRGAVIVETAIVLTILIFLLLGLFVGGLTVAQSQRMTAQVHEATRYASVHGADYERLTGRSSPTKEAIINQTIAPFNGTANLENFHVSIEWIDQATGTAYDWDQARRTVKSISARGEYVTNTVRVTANYAWRTPLYGTQTFTYIAERPMAN